MVLSGCGPRSESVSLIILQTGCLHGNIYPVSLNHAAPRQSYQYISAYVSSVREEAAKTGAEVVLFDLGNSLCGSFASEILDSENVAAFFNKVGYDAIIL
jgi:2',3'-cyclic-nucleotide 2'-phosphodiesterase (5'-nucleotidase family)